MGPFVEPPFGQEIWDLADPTYKPALPSRASKGTQLFDDIASSFSGLRAFRVPLRATVSDAVFLRVKLVSERATVTLTNV